jgi:hypothetical protein
MSTIRKAITISEEDWAITLLKPFSAEYSNQLFVIHEDAYGEAIGILTPISELRTKLNITEEEFDEILKQL